MVPALIRSATRIAEPCRRASLPVSSAEHFYALCRRARRGVDIYTDDPLKLQASLKPCSMSALGHDMSPSVLFHADEMMHGTGLDQHFSI